MAERQSAHRQDLERRTLEAQIEDATADRTEARIGQLCALVIGLAVITSITIVAVIHPGYASAIFGGVLGGGYLVALVTAFPRNGKAASDSTDKNK